MHGEGGIQTKTLTRYFLGIRYRTMRSPHILRYKQPKTCIANSSHYPSREIHLLSALYPPQVVLAASYI